MESILIVDDENGIRSTLSEILGDEGYSCASCATLGEARQTLEERAFDLLILDIWLPDGDGLELLQELQEQRPRMPVLVVSGHANIDIAVKALHMGAYDFLEKPLSLSRVIVTVENALERSRLARELEALSERLDQGEVLIGETLEMRRLKTDLRTAAASDSRILVVGENGTGKELVARQIHRLSSRRKATFVEVNCAAIPEELIESELFGHVKGAFTGATTDRSGRFEQAHQGTLFLDEVGDMSLKTQAKVLRVLQEQRFEQVGGARTIEVDVRVVAATNKDLDEAIANESFREDLYFRLAVIPLHVPPLRRRRDDIPLLAEHFGSVFARQLGRRPKQLLPGAIEVLQRYAWPGNVRELKNLIERMMIMVAGDEIGPGDLPPSLRDGAGRASPDLVERDFDSLRDARDAFEKSYIEHRLQRNDFNVSQTARELKLERSHLYRKLKSYGIEVVRE